MLLNICRIGHNENRSLKNTVLGKMHCKETNRRLIKMPELHNFSHVEFVIYVSYRHMASVISEKMGGCLQIGYSGKVIL